jgi:hypothetical protein
MNKHLISAAVALTLGLAATSSFAAISYTVTTTATSAEAGAITYDWDAQTPANFTFTGGGEFSGSIGGITAQPVGSTGNFWSVGPSGAQTTPGEVTFAAASYYGFLWGSPDTYNTVSFFNGDTLLASYDGNVVLDPANGDQAYSRYFNFYASGGDVITKVTFSSTQNAFETDNHALIAAVPEPESYAMMLAGLGLLGFMARRRRS